MQNFWSAIVGTASVIAISVSLVGCSDGGVVVEKLPVFPVEGQVKFNGKATPGAQVALHPVGISKPGEKPSARATVQPDGTFKITTYDSGDGAPEGEYKVTVEWRPLVQSGGDWHQGPNTLPAKYASPTTTDLKANVVAGSNTLPLEIR
jgi:hypothetical protein